VTSRNSAVSCRVSLNAGADLPRKTWQQHFQIVDILGWTVLAGLGLRQITHLSSRLSAPRVAELCGDVTQSFLFSLFNNAQCIFYMTQHTGEQVLVSASLSKFVFLSFLLSSYTFSSSSYFLLSTPSSLSSRFPLSCSYWVQHNCS